jgi:DNA replication and repair protein RecF
MLLQQLSLSNFRNFTQLDVEFPEGATILAGANAQGKTSLLEAAFFFTGASSPHTTSDRQLISFAAPDGVARLVGRFRSSDKESSRHEIEIRLIAEDARLRKEILINRQRKRALDLSGGFVSVLFLPQDMNIIEGSPGRRRQQIDSTLTQASPNYGRDLRKFRRVMTQRNALLKRLQERSASPNELAYWDKELAEYSAAIMDARAEAIAELESLAVPIHERLSNSSERLEIKYEPALEPSLVEDSSSLLDRIRASLDHARADEIARGITLVGPHRDEILYQLDDIPLRDFGSRGQNRTAMLALKLAEIQWLRSKSGKNPVLLLDEVMSELDPYRRRELLRELHSSPQAILTTSDIQMIDDEFRREATIWIMEEGKVRESS